MSEVPLPQRSVSVGLSCQTSQDHQSTGVSIHITAEPDPGLPPGELQQQLSGHATAALERQVGRMLTTNLAATDTPAIPTAPLRRSGRPRCRS